MDWRYLVAGFFIGVALNRLVAAIGRFMRERKAR